MAVATRSKGYPDVTSTENWKYTTTNNIKNFRNKDEAQRFIAGTVKIWKLESFKNGHLFIDNLLKSVENLERSTTTGFEYLDDNGDVCYILFLIQLMSDGKSIQITHTQHKLSRTGARRSGSDSVQVEESNAGRWLMQRAYEELRLPYDAINSNANHKNISTEYQIKINGEEHDLSTEQIAKLVSMHPTSPYNDEMHYHIMHRHRHSKAYLKGIPAIADFWLHLSHPEHW
ncbi:unnamed protein product, partial [Rotaria sp. Silwood1]